MPNKVFKTLEEQIEILKSKGLVINDYDKTKEILLRENYFFVNGYRTPFYQNGIKKFIEGCTFEELYSLFTFDRYFRNIIFKNILIIENNYKSIFSYVMSKNYGYKEKDYLNFKNFDNSRDKQRRINDLIRKIKRQIRINGSQNSATIHYIKNYGYIPMWVGIKVLSFGLVSEVFSILKNKDKEEIATYYKNIDINDMEDYLIVMSNYRNICAHEDVLYSHKTQKELPETKYHQILNIPKLDGEYIYGIYDIFGLIIIMKQLMTKDDFKMMINEINYEIERLSQSLKCITIDKVLYKMGFPSNYNDIVDID